MAHRKAELSRTINNQLNAYNQELHAICSTFTAVAAQKELDTTLAKEFLEVIRDYSGTFRGNQELYTDYLSNLTALLGNLEKMNKKNRNIFVRTLKKWMKKLSIYKDIDKSNYERFRNF